MNISESDKLAMLHSAQKALDADEPLSNVIRLCKKLAIAQADFVSLLWLEMELHDRPEDARITLSDLSLPGSGEIQRVFDTNFDRLKKLWLAEREYFEEDGGYDRDEFGEVVATGYFEYWEESVREMEERAARYEKNLRKAVAPKYSTWHIILRRIRGRIESHLLTLELQAEYGSLVSHAIEDNKKYVIDQLKLISPSAYKQFVQAEAKLRDATGGALNQASVSARLMLESLADALYPARDVKVQGSDGEYRYVRKNDTKNRLWMFVDDSQTKLSKESVRLVQSRLVDIGNRIDALHALANKGAHEFKSESDVYSEAFDIYQIIMESFYLAGDLLRLRALVELKSPIVEEEKSE